jgi:hypothetical protein
MSVDKENTKTQVQALRADTSQMRLKEQQIEKEVSKELPASKVCIVAQLHFVHLRGLPLQIIADASICKQQPYISSQQSTS